jgi:WD40 repeat protein
LRRRSVTASLASAGDDGTIRLWVTSTTAAPTVLRDNQGTGGSLTFSASGNHLVTSGNNAAVRIWRTDGSGGPLVLGGFRSLVMTVAPLKDDRYVTAHDDGTIRLWRCPACGPITEVLATASRNVTRDLTPEERRTYLPTNR